MTQATNPTTSSPGTRSRPASPAVTALAAGLLEELEPLTERLVAAILLEDVRYAGPGPLTRADLTDSCRSNLHQVLRAVVGSVDLSAAEALAPPRATGARRAEQGVPLESVLHAYRLGHRTIWEAMVAQARRVGELEPLVDAATEVWEVVDVFSGAVADSYRRTEAELARAGNRYRDAVLDALFDGRGAEPSVVADAAAVLGLDAGARYAVAVLTGPSDSRPAATAVAGRGLHSVWRSRAGTEVGLVALGPATPGDVAALLSKLPEARGGVSAPVPGLAGVAAGHRQAVTALQAATHGSPGVVDFDGRLPAALLVTAPEIAGRLVQRALGGVLELAEDERDLLLELLRAWLASDGSASRTASRLYCHRNTVLNRLRRLEAVTGLSIERLDDVAWWSLALTALDLRPPAGTGGRYETLP